MAVVLIAPVIATVADVCIVPNLLTAAAVPGALFIPVSVGQIHTSAAYNILGTTTAMYSCRIERAEASDGVIYHPRITSNIY